VTSTDETVVVLIHGLWMHGTVMTLIADRLQSHAVGEIVTYSYPSVGAGIDENIERLAAFLSGLSQARIDLVGHSLGGVIALRTVLECKPERIGRIVCLGSPLTDSSAARALQEWPGGSSLLGQAIRDAVLNHPLTAWPGEPEAGMIAGDLAMGAGLLLNALQGDNDGTVEVEETRLPGLTDHIVLPLSHTGLLLSSSVVEQTAHFLHHGHFQRD
jgi:pimeloyl-ACP methyl ester carboxylesterase